MNELSTEIKDFVALIKDSKDEVRSIPITESVYEKIIRASTNRDSHVFIDGEMIDRKKVEVRKMNDDLRKSLGGNVVSYTDKNLFGKLSGSTKCVYRFKRFEEQLRKKSNGGNIVKSIGEPYYGYYTEGQLVTIPKEMVIF
jgi:hypothetical protein